MPFNHAFHNGMEAQVLGICSDKPSRIDFDGGTDSLAMTELSFASGTHTRLGQDSAVHMLSQKPLLVRQILRRCQVASSVEQVLEALKEPCGSVSLHLLLSPGNYEIPFTIRVSQSVILSSFQTHSAEVVLLASDVTPMMSVRNSGSFLILRGLVLMHNAHSDQPVTIERRSQWPRCIEALNGAQLVLENCLLTSTFGAGVVSDGSRVTCRACEMDRCGISGAVALNGGFMELHGCCVQRSKTSGLITLDGQTAMTVCSSIVRDNVTSAACAYHGSQIQGSGCHFIGNDTSGVTVHGQASRIELTECKLQENRQSGASVQSGASASLKECMLGHNGETGADVLGAASILTMASCVVSDNHHSGIACKSGAGVSVFESHLQFNNLAGAYVCGKGSDVRITRCIIASNAMDGVSVVEGGQCVVAESMLEKNGNACGAAAGRGSFLQLQGSTVRGNGRVGALASDGAGIVLEECGLSLLCETALGAAGMDSKVVAKRCVLSRNVIGAWARTDGEIDLCETALPAAEDLRTNDTAFRVEAFGVVRINGREAVASA